MKLTLKQKSWIAVAVFVVVFAGLLVAATFIDLEVSHLLTKGALEDGAYLADDIFGVFFEIVGSSAIYILIGACATICFWFFIKVYNKKPWNVIFAVICAVAGTVAFWLMFSDIFGYVMEHILKDTFVTGGNEFARYELIHALEDNGAFIAVEILLAIAFEGLTILSMKSLSNETLAKLTKFVLASAVMAALANLLVMVIKEPVGRMRYRAMNSEVGQIMGGFDNFTKWFVSTDNNKVYNAKELFGYSDAFKSFPSGHTCAAGMVYALIMLIDVLEVKKTWHKVAIWVSTIVAVGLVAVSRIVVGAHFFSDVLMGGTLAFVSMIIAREIFISKGAHVKAMFGIGNSVDDDTTAEEDAIDDENAVAEEDVTVADENTDVVVEETTIAAEESASTETESVITETVAE